MPSDSGTEGSGGAFGAVAVAVGAVLLLEPVSPARLLGVFVVAGPNGKY